jgi:hypothetical protein
MNRWSNHKPNLSAMPETPMVKAQKRQNKNTGLAMENGLF